MRAELPALVQHTDVGLELPEPGPGPPIPNEIAHTVRALARGVLLAMLTKPEIGRIRLECEALGDELVPAVRDDGPAPLSEQTLATYRIDDRLHAVNGRKSLKNVAGWGSLVKVWLPLGRVLSTSLLHHPLNTLNPREVEVLALIALGRRNKAIAAELHITEHTVKFHVRNLLRKLGAGSRAEAAALANRVPLTT